ncbi:DUF3630 family protein [Agaribacter flavus]|uniref:DUF3630 family protein n=1 Tax=Agaribacter flavus TaxID=1902781 RepID=A0ABV7FW37_9ALTE
MQQLSPDLLKTSQCVIIQNAIVLKGLSLPDFEHATLWSKQLLELLGLKYIESEISADLIMVAAKFKDEMLFLKLNYTLEDMWFELAKHRESLFFHLFDHIDANLMTIGLFNPALTIK